MKINDIAWKTKGESFYPKSTNIIKRKFEDQKGLDTLVVQTINNEDKKHSCLSFT